MSTPVLDTKLFRPSARRGLVARPRLDDRLRPTPDTRLTLISAPAGFGKSTLLITWLGSLDDASAVAWVSLDERDGRAASFWTYLLTALDRAAPGTAADALTLLQSGQVPIETVLATVLNELTVLPDDLHLVLDDYHLADTPDVQPGMEFLLDHLPPQVHLMISTRADPALPLARLRGRGELVEIRATDLRMTRDEVATYLGETAGLDLAAPDVAALETRTEGWVAALQLAALSLRGREDTSAFIAGFAGDDRYVVDYLAEEVLDRQTAEVRDFLLDTSILDRLTGPLCDAVTRGSGGRQTLEQLDRQNLFVVPLDDSRRWYRYHHLFADVLHAHLIEERPEAAAELHRRASEWYDAAGEPLPAIRHALSADDVDRAADLMEAALPGLQRGRQEAVISSWSTVLPDSLVRRRPALAIGLVGGLMSSNQFGGIEARLRDIEAALAEPVDDPTLVAHVPAQIAMYRAALSLVSGDPSGTIVHANRAIELAGDEDLPLAAAAALSGLASWTGGDLEAAHRGYSTATAGLQRAGHVADVLGCTITLSDLEITQGRLRDARRTLERALALGAAEAADLPGTGDMHVGLARLALERDDLDAARAHLRTAEELGERVWLPQNPYRWRVVMAGIRAAEGDLDAARSLLDAAERVYVGDYSPDVRPVAAHRARVMVARGDLAAAREWARERGLAAEDEPTYLREFEHLTLARLLIAEGNRDKAARLLDKLLAAAEAGGRTGTVIEILVLQSLATGDPAPRERALALGEPEGYVRVFLADEPGPTSPQPPRPKPADQGLIDPLSERELDVLRYLASDLSGPDIARELVVSLNTVRTHTKHIFMKLDVNNRRQAVTRAHQLNLL